MSSWRETTVGLVKEYSFIDFVKAIKFVNRVAELSEKKNHHPDILVHSYNNVKITLITYDESKITSKDYKLAKLIDEI